MKQDSYKFFANYSSRHDLQNFKDNSLLLYALQLRYSIEDINEVAATSLVDGSDDKKTDLIYIDIEKNEAVIAQGYLSKKEKKEAPANKASDLNTAASWLINRQINELPEKLQSPARELRDSIKSGELKKITLWFCHNLPESENVQKELKSAEQTLNASIKRNFVDSEIECLSLEVGLKQLEEWYLGLTTPILVSDNIILKDVDGYEIKGEDWRSFSTYFPAKKLYDLYRRNNKNLFSANVRDYLGSRKSDSNINNSIKITCEENPENFFVYNNGVTALVNDFTYDKGKSELKISGFSIVNGAQTTGAIGSIKKTLSEKIFVPLRLIKCDNSDIIAEIVKYNNSQNKINAPDFRSNDDIQKRIKKEFQELGSIEYSARRGGSVDVITRNPNLLPSVTAGQVLAAFHGHPGVAYNEKSKIWESDKLYSTFFNEHTTAKHIFFIYSLLKALEGKKLELVEKEVNQVLTKSEMEFLSYLRTRGSFVLFISASSKCLEEILGRPLTNLFYLHFCKKLSIENAVKAWIPIIDILSSFSSNLKKGLKDGIKNQDSTDKAIDQFAQLVGATKNANSTVFTAFSSLICN